MKQFPRCSLFLATIFVALSIWLPAQSSFASATPLPLNGVRSCLPLSGTVLIAFADDQSIFFPSDISLLQTGVNSLIQNLQSSFSVRTINTIGNRISTNIATILNTIVAQSQTTTYNRPVSVVLLAPNSAANSVNAALAAFYVEQLVAAEFNIIPVWLLQNQNPAVPVWTALSASLSQTVNLFPITLTDASFLPAAASVIASAVRSQPGASCDVFGMGHVSTMDGLVYDLSSANLFSSSSANVEQQTEIVLFQSNGYPTFGSASGSSTGSALTVQSRVVPCSSISSSFSSNKVCVSAIAATDGANTIEVDVKSGVSSLIVNGKAVSLTSMSQGSWNLVVTPNTHGVSANITFTQGHVIQFSINAGFFTTLSIHPAAGLFSAPPTASASFNSLSTKVTGLCGNFNGCPFDDAMDRCGVIYAVDTGYAATIATSSTIQPNTPVTWSTEWVSTWHVDVAHRLFTQWGIEDYAAPPSSAASLTSTSCTPAPAYLISSTATSSLFEPWTHNQVLRDSLSQVSLTSSSSCTTLSSGGLLEACLLDGPSSSDLSTALIDFNIDMCLLFCQYGYVPSTLINAASCQLNVCGTSSNTNIDLHYSYTGMSAQQLPNVLMVGGSDPTTPTVFQPALGLAGTYTFQVSSPSASNMTGSCQPVRIVQLQVTCQTTVSSVYAGGGVNVNLMPNSNQYPQVRLQGSTQGGVPRLQSWKFMSWPQPISATSSSSSSLIPPPLITASNSNFARFTPQLTGDYILEFAVWDGCTISRSNITVTANCAPQLLPKIFLSTSVSLYDNPTWGLNNFNSITVSTVATAVTPIALDPNAFVYTLNATSVQTGYYFNQTGNSQYIVLPLINSTSPSAPYCSISLTRSAVSAAVVINVNDYRSKSFASSSWWQTSPCINTNLALTVSSVDSKCASTPDTLPVSIMCDGFVDGVMSCPPDILNNNAFVAYIYGSGFPSVPLTSNSLDSLNRQLVLQWSVTTSPANSKFAIAPVFQTSLQTSTSFTASFTPDVAGSYTVQMLVSNGCQQVAKQVTIVTKCNYTAPSFALPAPQSTTFAGQTVVFSVPATYQLGNQAFFTYGWTVTSNSVIARQPIISNPTTPTLSVTPFSDSTYTAKLTVSDGCQSSSFSTSLTFTCDTRITMNAVATPSSFSYDYGLHAFQKVNIDATASTLISPTFNPNATYAFSFFSLPLIPSFLSQPSLSVNGGVASFTPTFGGTYVILVTVTDGCTIATQQVTVSAVCGVAPPTISLLFPTAAPYFIGTTYGVTVSGFPLPPPTTVTPTTPNPTTPTPTTPTPTTPTPSTPTPTTPLATTITPTTNGTNTTTNGTNTTTNGTNTNGTNTTNATKTAAVVGMRIMAATAPVYYPVDFTAAPISGIFGLTFSGRNFAPLTTVSSLTVVSALPQANFASSVSNTYTMTFTGTDLCQLFTATAPVTIGTPSTPGCATTGTVLTAKAISPASAQFDRTQSPCIALDGSSSVLNGRAPATVNWQWRVISAPSTSTKYSPIPFTLSTNGNNVVQQQGVSEFAKICFFPDVAGSYTFGLTLIDACATTSYATTSFLASCANDAPLVVVFATPDSVSNIDGVTPVRIQLNAAQSVGASGAALSFSWSGVMMPTLYDGQPTPTPPMWNTPAPTTQPPTTQSPTNSTTATTSAPASAPVQYPVAVHGLTSSVASVVVYQPGVYNFTVNVTDGCNIVTRYVAVTVGCGNEFSTNNAIVTTNVNWDASSAPLSVASFAVNSATLFGDSAGSVNSPPPSYVWNLKTFSAATGAPSGPVNTGSSGLSTAQVAGISVGSVVGGILVIVAVVFLVKFIIARRGKFDLKRQAGTEMH